MDNKRSGNEVLDKHVKINTRLDSIMKTDLDFKLSIFAALIVLFSAMIDPRISVVLSLIAMISFSVYKYAERKRHKR